MWFYLGYPLFRRSISQYCLAIDLRVQCSTVMPAEDKAPKISRLVNMVYTMYEVPGMFFLFVLCILRISCVFWCFLCIFFGTRKKGTPPVRAACPTSKIVFPAWPNFRMYRALKDEAKIDVKMAHSELDPGFWRHTAWI